MRSIRLMAATTVILTAAWGCGDDGGTDVGNPPVASFDQQCTGLTCNFADHSTPADRISSWSWDFNDPNSGPSNNTSTAQNPVHTFTAAGTFNVKLTVTDVAGASNSQTNAVTVAAAGNLPPTAAFTFICNAGACTFNSSTSTDADGTIASYLWDFGDPASGTSNSSTDPNPTHTYTVTAPTDFNVKLTITDDDGATDDVTQVVAIEPSSSAVCTVEGSTIVNCTLDVTQRATLTITVTSRDCEIGGNKFEIMQPIRRTVFFNGCSVPVGTQYTPTDASGAPFVFEAGTQVQTRFTQGTGIDPGDPIPGPPEIRPEGAFPEWTLHIDDGGAPGLPRNDDILLTITATPQ